MECSLNTTDANPRSRANNVGKSDISAKRDAFDGALATAFRAMEDDVCNLRDAGRILEMVTDRVMGSVDGEGDQLSISVSRKDWETLFFAMYQVVNRADDLQVQYMKVFDGLKTIGSA